MSHAKLKDRGDDRVVDLVECDQVVQSKNKNIDKCAWYQQLDCDSYSDGCMDQLAYVVKTGADGEDNERRIAPCDKKRKKKKRLNLNPEASFIVPKVSHLSQAVLELKEGYCFRSAATGHGCTKR